MWGVFNADNRLLKSFLVKEYAEKYADECNAIMQSCGFHVKDI